jgi:Holliday junction resolvasome RuvABC endonuclease subunit
LDQTGDHYEVLAMTVLTTKKDSKKVKTGLRVSSDDQRRFKEAWDLLQDFRKAPRYGRPRSIGIEVYTPRPGKGSSGWKVSQAYQLACDFAYHLEMQPVVSTPGDLKKRACGTVKASKGEVQEALPELIEGFTEALEGIPEKLREHAADAAGHAVLGWEEIQRIRKLAGVDDG